MLAAANQEGPCAARVIFDVTFGSRGEPVFRVSDGFLAACGRALGTAGRLGSKGELFTTRVQRGSLARSEWMAVVPRVLLPRTTPER